MKIYESAVRKPIMTILVFVGVIILGLFSLRNLSVDLMPDIEMNVLMVITTYDGASAADIETNVTRPLENVLNTVPNLKKITSTSRENRSLVMLQFEFGKNLDELTNDVRDKLNLVKAMMPENAEEPIIMKFSTDMIPVIMFSATADKSIPALYRILDDNVANRLARIDGVGTVSIAGAPQRQIQVYVDPIKMEAHNLTVETIAQKIGAENLNVPTGTMDIGNETFSLRVQGEFKDPSEINSVIVGNYGGKPIFLSDVATVTDGFEERVQESYTNGVQGAVIVIQKQSGANTVDIANQVLKVMPEIQKNLPPDVKLTVINDTSDGIKKTISGLVETVLFAFIFVMIVVLFFLGRWRATIIIILTIPVSLIASFIYLYATGGTLNIVSLSSLSIAIGMVVDDAIVVLENITTHIERGSRPKSAAVHGTNEVSLSVVASTLTLIAVFFPLTLVSGFAGVMFKELGWIVTIIMTMSLICAMTLTPMLSAQMLRLDRNPTNLTKKIYAPIQRFLDWLDVKYAQFINWTVRNRKKTVIFALLFFIVSLIPIITVGTEFFPTTDGGYISARIELPVGTRMEITRDLAMNLQNKWKKENPEIETISFSVGQASSSNVWGSLQNNASHVISFDISLVELKERSRSVYELIEQFQKELALIPEIRKSNVSTGQNGMMGGQSQLEVDIFGYDFEETDRIAQELQDRFKKIQGLSNIQISREEYVPEYQVDFDREKLALHGLNMATASNFLKNRINGLTASLYREDGEEYFVRVSYDPRYRQSLADVENILIYNMQGMPVRVKDVGTVVERFTPPTIERKDRQRVVTVNVTLAGTTMDRAVSAINNAISEVDVPSEIFIDIGGSYEDQQESFADLGVLFLIIVLLVYIVMASQFESLTYPFIIMFSVPFGLSGVVLAMWITNGTLNIMSFIGLIMLVGIVVKNGIVLVDYINLNRERGMGIIRSVISGGRSRLRPVLMTTATTILGMLPLALSQSEGSEMWRPMAITVIGGLTVSTILTLLVIPVLYAIMAGIGVKRQSRKMAKKLAVNQ
ncbi:MAG: efflux RND transporter permease subunit [Bacteroidales bacterium]|nr:efflux RND transporter permease subunit [Bacteroidales bacterium]